MINLDAYSAAINPEDLTFMFAHSTRFANIMMVVATLALCISVCTQPHVGFARHSFSAEYIR
jgi:hypothetical protein